MKWSKIKGFPNYEICDEGLILTSSGRLIGGTLDYNKNRIYVRFNLYNEFGKSKKKRLHRLLGDAFLENPHNLPTVDHLDGNGQNNNLFNLRWATHSDNSQNTVVQKNNLSTGIKNISYYKSKKGFYFKKSLNGVTFSKYCKSLEEALFYKNKFYKEHDSEFMIKNSRDEKIKC